MSAKRGAIPVALEAEAIRLVESGMSRAAAAKEMKITKGKITGLLDRAGRRGDYQRPIADGPPPWRAPEPAHNGCRWVFGNPWASEWHWCDKRVHRPGASWCAEHRSQVWGHPAPPVERKRVLRGET